MNAADYVAGVHRIAGEQSHAEHVRLAGTPQPTEWDPGLAEVMAATGRVVYEESVADTLLTDLSASRAS
jgi:Protein of unknown function C-terminus (DUF2399)